MTTPCSSRIRRAASAGRQHHSIITTPSEVAHPALLACRRIQAIPLRGGISASEHKVGCCDGTGERATTRAAIRGHHDDTLRHVRAERSRSLPLGKRRKLLWPLGRLAGGEDCWAQDGHTWGWYGRCHFGVNSSR